MKNSISYLKIKRDKVGNCNICGKEGKLSWDHVPPKGAIIYSDVEILAVADTFVGIDKPSGKYSQNGLRFRTICAECNNLIGSKYDIVFNDFIYRLIGMISKNIGKTDLIEISVDIEGLAKSILGHMLAAKGEVENTVIDAKMKDVVLGGKKFGDLNIHYWFYPYGINQVMREILVAKIREGENALVSILTLYPIAFLVTDTDMFLGKVARLSDHYNISGDKGESIKLDLSLFYDYRWPVIVDEDTFIMVGQSINSSVMVVPRLKR